MSSPWLEVLRLKRPKRPLVKLKLETQKKANYFEKSGIFTLLELNINASYPILSGLVINRAFKGQNVKADPKN